jgi:hypothetical protein
MDTNVDALWMCHECMKNENSICGCSLAQRINVKTADASPLIILMENMKEQSTLSKQGKRMVSPVH